MQAKSHKQWSQCLYCPKTISRHGSSCLKECSYKRFYLSLNNHRSHSTLLRKKEDSEGGSQSTGGVEVALRLAHRPPPTKKLQIRDSAASTAHDLGLSCSEDSVEVGSSDLDSDSDGSSPQPGPSTPVSKVSTTYGGYILPNAPCRAKFLRKRTPGVHLDVTRLSETRSFKRALDMFMMFFTAELVSTVCQYTKYAWLKIFEKPSYAEADGSWPEVTPPPEIF
ncbi:hypothetical protein MRX96_014513 [Rhipicephalus microplus]